MKAVDRLIHAVASKDVNLTFSGESGTGKELLARRAHELSKRRHGPFVPINCAAIPEGLFESELFGHERGAFTGANVLAIGKVESANGGTLFLDEIGEMPIGSQAKLLRFLETRRFMRVGGTRKIEADVRLMTATLRSLDVDVRTGRFRSDLFYRIQGIPIPVPPLRERRADIAPLLPLFVEEAARRHDVSPPRLTREAKRLLLVHDWPGNVRELRNVMEMLCLLRSGRAVRAVDLPESIRLPLAGDPDRGDAPTSTLTLDLDEGYDALCGRILDRALACENGNTARAAARIGVSVRTLQRHLAKSRIG